MITKSIDLLLDRLEIGDKDEIIRNPFSGQEVTLNPTEVALYDFIKGCEFTGHYGDDFQVALDYFINENVHAYTVLLD